MDESSFAIIKPEGMQYAKDIESRIEKSGLKIKCRKNLLLTGNQFDTIYYNARKNIPDVYEKMKKYMTSNAVILLKVTGDDAIRKLLEVRGSSNPAKALPGTIRGDYARDQDYDRLYSQGKFAKNVFHAADAAEAKEMLGIFFSGEK